MGAGALSPEYGARVLQVTTASVSLCVLCPGQRWSWGRAVFALGLMSSTHAMWIFFLFLLDALAWTGTCCRMEGPAPFLHVLLL